MTQLGKAIRIGRLLSRASGRVFTVALDHAPSYGVLPGLEGIEATLSAVAAGEPDAVLLMKGTAERCFAPYAGRLALIVKCSTLSPYHPERDVWVTQVDDALRLGADAVAMALTVGSPEQPALLENLAGLVRQAEAAGMPVIVHAYPNGSLVPADERYTSARVAYASRLAMELGVDIVKTFYTGSAESFVQVVQAAAPALVVAAGGACCNTPLDALTMAYNVVQAGGAGVTFGRNVWQSGRTTEMVRALADVVHRGAAPQEAASRLHNWAEALE